MAREQDSFDAEATPVVGTIRGGLPPILPPCSWVMFIHKPIDTLELENVALIVLAVVLVVDFLF